MKEDMSIAASTLEKYGELGRGANISCYTPPMISLLLFVFNKGGL